MSDPISPISVDLPTAFQPKSSLDETVEAVRELVGLGLVAASRYYKLTREFLDKHRTFVAAVVGGTAVTAASMLAIRHHLKKEIPPPPLPSHTTTKPNRVVRALSDSSLHATAEVDNDDDEDDDEIQINMGDGGGAAASSPAPPTQPFERRVRFAEMQSAMTPIATPARHAEAASADSAVKRLSFPYDKGTLGYQVCEWWDKHRGQFPIDHCILQPPAKPGDPIVAQIRQDLIDHEDRFLATKFKNLIQNFRADPSFTEYPLEVCVDATEARKVDSLLISLVEVFKTTDNGRRHDSITLAGGSHSAIRLEELLRCQGLYMLAIFNGGVSDNPSGNRMKVQLGPRLILHFSATPVEIQMVRWQKLIRKVNLLDAPRLRGAGLTDDMINTLREVRDVVVVDPVTRPLLTTPIREDQGAGMTPTRREQFNGMESFRLLRSGRKVHTAQKAPRSARSKRRQSSRFA